ncbi:helix-turn-helix transcriptional regulator [Streptomyces sp. TRM70350]|uniref:helix-turn-helix domain-containing protein n=1 Tax=Streptomyces sp. TRM70350 TaxID=2856165 RepID=UPI001C486BF5|nr:helix-turn-helix transcriptional regulator [Streptomyces sp. TRM70350]MBV7698450.1 helix-turn-helix domain-containing protein [Streptomyces sp. TRM70350]
MGRRENELDPDEGPVQRLAHELRLLREKAGSPSYRELARRAGYSGPTLSEAAAGRRLPSLSVTLAYVSACGGDQAEWTQRWRAASNDAVRAAATDDAPAPYRGLARYGTDDRHLFFGRAPEVDRLLRMMAEHRFAALVGASGSGKSSLLRAGVVPVLRDGGAVDFQPSAVRICTPGADPVRDCGALLAPAQGTVGDTVVVVDQFEELFTLCPDPAQRRAFIEMLLTAREADSRMRTLIAVRADFFGHCAEHQGLVRAIDEAHLLVSAMSVERLREAIVRPAGAVGLIVERAVTDRILAEVADEPGGLPLMSHTLLELWRRRKGKRLALSAYDAIGGVRGAVAHTANDVFNRFGPAEADAARAMLLRLISPGEGGPDTRRPVPLSELRARGVGAEVLERMVAARLLTVDGDSVELAHEALITAWPRLRGWVEDERERLRLHRRLTEATRVWEGLARDPGALYRGALLRAAREAFTTADGEPVAELNESEGAFLAASVAEDERALREAVRSARRVQVLATLLVVVVASALTAWVMWFLTREHP